MAERQETNGLDPITLEVVRHKVEGIANEMEDSLLRSSYSPIVKEGLDASAALFLPDGTTLAQACAIPIHLGTLVPAVGEILRAFPVAAMKDGDIYVLNDPYAGGTHLPDIAVVMPVFHRGHVIALSAAMTHHQDVGGLTPGSVPTNAREIFQEGIRIPALKLRDAGVFNDTLLRLLQLNVRIPEIFMGDLNAEVAACTVGARRLGELAESYGGNRLAAIFATLIDRSETMTRAALRALPAGTYRHVEHMDNDGVDLDQRIRIEVAATIADGTITFDFTGTNRQVRGPLNTVPSGTLAAAFYAVRAITDPDIPTNGGCFRPVRVVLPEGSIVNPHPPAPVNARTATIKAITSTIMGALGQAIPGRAPAGNAGALLVMAFGGRKPGGASYVVGDLVAGGSGAGPESDGVDVIETDASNCMNLPAESLEMEAPIRLNRVGLRPDSGGAGSRRGGLGVVREYEILAGDVTFSHRGERHFTEAPGVAGGKPGASAVSTIHRADGRLETVPSKIETILRKGDRLVVETAGGGGYGDPRKRDPEAVRRDIASGKVTPEAARRDYGRG
ncbi:MAG: hydantoinase B/oxoprolinase family protein [Alphaproteobacteria bacterium]